MKLRPWLASAVLLIGATATLLLLDWSARSPIEVSAIPPERGPERSTAAQAALAPILVGQEDFSKTLQRPLFWKTRRPFVPTPEPPSLPPPEPLAPVEMVEAPPLAPPDLSLRGVVIDGEEARAFVVSSGVPAGLWVSHGQSIEGWTVAEIARERLVLRSATAETVLKLYVENPQP